MKCTALLLFSFLRNLDYSSQSLHSSPQMHAHTFCIQTQRHLVTEMLRFHIAEFFHWEILEEPFLVHGTTTIHQLRFLEEPLMTSTNLQGRFEGYIYIIRTYKSSCMTLGLCLSNQACSRGRFLSIQRMFSPIVS